MLPWWMFAACAAPADRAARAPQTALSALAPTGFTYVGPGSMGRFVDYARHPSWPDVIAAGADVGGIYLSTDDGASWANLTRDLPTNGVWAVAWSVDQVDGVEQTRLILGTDSGLYHSPALDSSAGIDPAELDTWTEASGLDRGDARPDAPQARQLYPFHGNQRSMPIGALAVSPVDPDLVWAGITATGQMNLAQDPKDPASLQRFDRWKLFRSADGGQSWSPALRMNAEIPAFVVTPYDSAGSVFSILPDPEDADHVTVATDRGLYRSLNATTDADADADGVPDLSWQEIGTDAPRATEDAGQTWTDESARCASFDADPSAEGWCLPIGRDARVLYVIDPSTGRVGPGLEDHPNLRTLARATVDGVDTLYAAVWDRGHADDEAPDCDGLTEGDTFVDTNLEWYRGGIWQSTDQGETWTWTLTDDGRPDGTALLTNLSYRCDKHASERNSDDTITFFPAVSAPDTYDGGVLLVAGTLGASSGLYTYTPGADPAWVYQTDKDDDDYKERFEGSSPLNLSGTGATEVSRLLVDWDDATDGYPPVAFGHRGVTRGTWDPTDARYEYVHLGSDYQGKSDGMTAWLGTGLDDAVVWDVVETDDYAYVAVSDGALLRVEETDLGWVYTPVAKSKWTPNWSTKSSDSREDEVRALALDAETGVVYAGGYVTAEGHLYQVLAGADTSWSVIGGVGYTSDAAEAEVLDAEHYNGLWSGSPLHRVEMNKLIAIPASSGLDLDLIAAGSDGLWTWSDTRDPGAQWEQLCPSLSDALNWEDLVWDPSLVEGFAFAAASEARKDAVLAIDLATETCSVLRSTAYEDTTGALVTGIDPIRKATALALAQDADGSVRLVVGATYPNYIGLFSAALSCGSTCSLGTWRWAWTGEGVYEADSPKDLMMRRMDLGDLAVDPSQPSAVLAGFRASPGYDDYNPDLLLGSEDGGQTWEAIDATTAAMNLPNRSLNVLRYSEDGAWLYAGSRAALYRAPVTW